MKRKVPMLTPQQMVDNYLKQVGTVDGRRLTPAQRRRVNKKQRRLMIV